MDVRSERLVEGSYAFGMLLDYVTDAHQEAILAEVALCRLARGLGLPGEFVNLCLEGLAVCKVASAHCGRLHAIGCLRR